MQLRATRSFGLYSAPVLATWRAPNSPGVTVEVCQAVAVDSTARQLAALAVRAATFYRAQYGVRYGRPRLRLVVPPAVSQRASPTWSYALPGDKAGTLLRAEPGASEEQTFYTVGHEVAHHWWHAAPYPNSSFQSYLNEGFAEYACLDFYRAEYGEAAFALLLTRYRTIAESLPPVPQMASDLSVAARNQFIYVKAAYALCLLEAHIGRPAMRHLLRRAVQEAPASHTVWLALVEESVGLPARQFFEAHF